MAEDELRLRIRNAEAALMAHAPDPFSGLCHTCRVPGPCAEYGPAANLLGELRDMRDMRELGGEAVAGD